MLANFFNFLVAPRYRSRREKPVSKNIGPIMPNISIKLINRPRPFIIRAILR